MVLIDTNELRYWPALYESPELRDDASAMRIFGHARSSQSSNDLSLKPYFWLGEQLTSFSLGLGKVMAQLARL